MRIIRVIIDLWLDKKLCWWKSFNKKRKITGTWIFHSVTDDFPTQTKNCGREMKIFSEHKRPYEHNEMTRGVDTREKHMTREVNKRFLEWNAVSAHVMWFSSQPAHLLALSFSDVSRTFFCYVFWSTFLLPFRPSIFECMLAVWRNDSLLHCSSFKILILILWKIYRGNLHIILKYLFAMLIEWFFSSIYVSQNLAFCSSSHVTLNWKIKQHLI